MMEERHGRFKEVKERGEHETEVKKERNKPRSRGRRMYFRRKKEKVTFEYCSEYPCLHGILYEKFPFI